MVQAQDIEVSTVVSQELRDLLRPSAPALAIPGRVTNGQNCKRIALRRDGARPLRFCGQLLFQTNGTWTQGQEAFDHGLSVFIDDTQTVIAALSLCPQNNARLRPSFWARGIPDKHTFERLLDQWCRNVLALVVEFDQAAQPLAARDALHSMTAHALRAAQSH